MPTENERKYVLTDPEAVLALCPLTDWDDVRQGYLPGGPRIRRRARDARTTDSFTYKIDAAGRLVEIETILEPRDFDDLWPLTTKRVHKLRRSMTDRHGLSWDIDLFLNEDGRFYFAMAECEMPEAMEAPPEVPPQLEPLIRYLVPRERQTEFLNSRLGDQGYTAKLSF